MPMAAAAGLLALVLGRAGPSFKPEKPLADPRVNFPAHSYKEILLQWWGPRVSRRGERAIAALAQHSRTSMYTSFHETEPEVVVLAWHGTLHGLIPRDWPDKSEVIKRCNMKCRWTPNRKMVPWATAIAISTDSHRPHETKHLPRESVLNNSVVIATTIENNFMKGQYVQLGMQLHHVNLLATHELDSDVPLFYLNEFNWHDPGGDLAALPSRKLHGAAIAAFISDCFRTAELPRLTILEALARHVPVHQYGACGGPGIEKRKDERNVVGTASSPSRYQSQRAIFSEYRFASAMENSMALDYVTEKVFHALSSGVVPLYVGAPNVHDFLPCEPPDKCVIFIPDYVNTEGVLDTRRLGAHLNHLATNDSAYAEYHTWRRKPPSKRWLNILEITKHETRCRVCNCLRGRLGCPGVPGALPGASDKERGKKGAAR